jgi:phytoene desaturase
VARLGACYRPSMTHEHVLIVGGGLAGLAAGCYLSASGFKTTIIEHNITLGGVCSAWKRGPYTIDGCIHWLMGGPFSTLYDELGITAQVKLQRLDEFVTYDDARTGARTVISADLKRTAQQLIAIAPEDRVEIERIMDGAEQLVHLAPPIDPPPELSSLLDQLSRAWEMRHGLGAMIRFRQPLGVWADEHLKSATLRRLFSRLLPAEAPALFLLMVLGHLKHGQLSRPEGGTARFRDALIETYRRLGGAAVLHATVDEILVARERAVGVRLADGSILAADAVISTASAPETVLRLLGGRYEAQPTRDRLQQWKLFPPIVLASYGVELPLPHVPSSWIIDNIPSFSVGGHLNDHLSVRVDRGYPSAPGGHSVVQLLLQTDYKWWATRGATYNHEKDSLGELLLEVLETRLPGVRASTRMSDVATPLTFWNMARAWRGSYEGWMPTPEAFFSHIKKTLNGLRGLYLAGQWVEPGGGVPTALMSGRQAAQLLCVDHEQMFATPKSISGAA